jgi:F-type H+-transporting ATPase subunit epsilon
MADTLHITVVTPERTILSVSNGLSLTCETEQGQITILPEHVALVSPLVSGGLVVKTADGEQDLHVAGGFITVNHEGHVMVLADAAEKSHEIDAARAEQAMARAKAAQREKVLTEEEYAVVQNSLRKSLSRLSFYRKHNRTNKPTLTSDNLE